MKKLVLMLALAGICGAPAFAQEVEGPKGPEREMSQQEMLAELHRLMAKASKEMEASETELAKASLPASKADVLAERVKVLREQMEKGELKEIPEGLREYIRQNPEKAAEFAGKSTEEFKKLIEDEKQLEGTIKKSPEMLKKMAASEETFKKILDHQYEAERKIGDVLKSQEESIKAASENQDGAIELAHQLRQQGQGKGEPDKPDKNKSETKDPREGKDQPKGGQPDQPAPKEYKPGEQPIKPKEETEDFTTDVNKDGFQADKKVKKVGDDTGAGSDNREPTKYKGFKAKFEEELRKRTEAAKKPADPK